MRRERTKRAPDDKAVALFDAAVAQRHRLSDLRLGQQLRHDNQLILILRPRAERRGERRAGGAVALGGAATLRMRTCTTMEQRTTSTMYEKSPP